jgi:pilus assembly protein Flp/PilA
VITLFQRFIRSEDGATAIEYGLIAGLVAVGIIAALTVFGGSVQGMFGRIRDKAGNAMDAAGI